jgi:GTP cyclohydrolase II
MRISKMETEANRARVLEAAARLFREKGVDGIAVVERVPHVFPANDHNERYLRTKAARSGHLF